MLNKYLQLFLKFLEVMLPILGVALTRALADEFVRYAYKDESIARAKAAHPSNGEGRRPYSRSVN